MIRLVEKSISAIYEFVIYFVMLICIMSAFNKVLGYDIGSENSKGEFVSEARDIWNYIKHTFINSVGGIEEP